MFCTNERGPVAGLEVWMPRGQERPRRRAWAGALVAGDRAGLREVGLCHARLELLFNWLLSSW